MKLSKQATRRSWTCHVALAETPSLLKHKLIRNVIASIRSRIEGGLPDMLSRDVTLPVLSLSCSCLHVRHMHVQLACSRRVRQSRAAIGLNCLYETSQSRNKASGQVVAAAPQVRMRCRRHEPDPHFGSKRHDRPPKRLLIAAESPWPAAEDRAKSSGAAAGGQHRTYAHRCAGCRGLLPGRAQDRRRRHVGGECCVSIRPLAEDDSLQDGSLPGSVGMRRAYWH